MASHSAKRIVTSFIVAAIIFVFADSVRASSIVLAALPAQASEAKPPPAEKKSSKKAESQSCSTCVFVVDRMKKDASMALPAICADFVVKSAEEQAMCEQVVNSIPLDGNNERYWLFEGCYKYEEYQAKEWVEPCPSHVQCTTLKQLNNTPFCTPAPMEDPFQDDPLPAASDGKKSGD